LERRMLPKFFVKLVWGCRRDEEEGMREKRGDVQRRRKKEERIRGG
jgi:hypothetical protein